MKRFVFGVECLAVGQEAIAVFRNREVLMGVGKEGGLTQRIEEAIIMGWMWLG